MQGDGVAVAGEVAGQVAAHNAEPGDPYLRGCLPGGGHLLPLLSLIDNGHYATCGEGLA
jgi:hypothetical protein